MFKEIFFQLEKPSMHVSSDRETFGTAAGLSFSFIVAFLLSHSAYRAIKCAETTFLYVFTSQWVL